MLAFIHWNRFTHLLFQNIRFYWYFLSDARDHLYISTNSSQVKKIIIYTLIFRFFFQICGLSIKLIVFYTFLGWSNETLRRKEVLCVLKPVEVFFIIRKKNYFIFENNFLSQYWTLDPCLTVENKFWQIFYDITTKSCQ